MLHHKKPHVSCYSYYYFLFKTRRRATTSAAAACTLPVDPPSSYDTTPRSNHHKSLCFNLTDQLLSRGLLPFAKLVFRRIIKQSSSVSDALSLVDYANSRGLELDLNTYGLIVRKMVGFGRPELAEDLYMRDVIRRGIEPDSGLLNSMVICFCRLGKLDEARTHFDRLIGLDIVPCVSACNAMLWQFCEREMFYEAFKYFVVISDAGARLGVRCYNMLFDSLADMGYLDEALEVLRVMQEKLGFMPKLHQHKSLFHGLCRRGRAMEAEIVLGEMERWGFVVDKTVFTHLIYGYCKDRKMKMAMRVYFRMLKSGCNPDKYTFTTLIHGCHKFALFDKDQKVSDRMMKIIYRQMRNRCLHPDAVTYHTMISSYCRQGKVECALELLRDMARQDIAPSLHSYTALIPALYQDNRIAEADELCQNVLEKGFVPDHILFFVIMKMHPKGHELQVALYILLTIATNGCQYDPSMLLPYASVDPSQDMRQKMELLVSDILTKDVNLGSTAFAIYISALCQSGDIDTALHVMDKMVDKGCQPSLFTYNSLIKCFCKKGMFEEAESLINQMQDSGILPDVETFLIMVHEHCKQGNLNSAFDVLHQMKKRGVNPNVAIYDSIICCLGKKRQMYRAEKMFMRMLDTCLDPDESVYMAMINAYAKRGRLLKACKLFERMVENSIRPSLYSYTLLISSLIKKNMVEKGCMYLKRMIQDGLEPNNVLYTCLIGHFLKEGELDFAFKLDDLMKRQMIEYDFITCVVLLSGLCRYVTGANKMWGKTNRASERAKGLLSFYLHRGSFVSESSYLKISVDSPEEMKHFALKKLMKTIKNDYFVPNLYLYNSLILGFCRLNMMRDAYDHVDLMLKDGLCPNEVTFTILIKEHIYKGEIDHAVALFNQMNAIGCPPDKGTYNTLLRGLVECGRLQDALSLSYTTMRKKGIFPSLLSYECLIAHLFASGLGILALKTDEDMKSHYHIDTSQDCLRLCENSILEKAQLDNNLVL